MRLLRKVDSEGYFRIIDSTGTHDDLTISEPNLVDFNIRTAVFIPIYADPVDEKGRSSPLEIILEENQTFHSYVFLQQNDILSFQEALTGYKVAAGYTQ